MSKLRETSEYLSNMVDIKEVFVDIGKAIASEPDVGFSINCYHYETKNVRSMNADGSEGTST